MLVVVKQLSLKRLNTTCDGFTAVGRCAVRWLSEGFQFHGDKPERRVFVTGIPQVSNESDLHNHMQAVGGLKHVHIFRDRLGNSSGRAIVEYSDKAFAQKAIATLGYQSFMGSRLYMRQDRDNLEEMRAIGPTADPRTVRLANVPPHVEWQDLKDIGRSIAPLACAVVIGERNEHLGIEAVIKFRSVEGAKLAASKLDNAKLSGIKIRCMLATEFDEEKLIREDQRDRTLTLPEDESI
uniref:RRM domain-containing protein n=1 Tax=Rhodosorus marinus TaxID=101924 RepID=A0A7S0G5X2_9RHOD|mmetsp:Transcript_56/g.47  ORF Transcript_56/g.47 Transcript_56/m.47 type:complete len:238 (+) Transcript_56:71-784(+)